MRQSLNFHNEGFGWVCRHCERELTRATDKIGSPSRFMTEGEAEANQPRMSTPALAKWADAAQRTLVCPRCGITELIDIS